MHTVRARASQVRSRGDRRAGLALMVVMIVFVVLYMVVYHLHFYTKMEEKVAKVRHGDIQALDALQSVGQYVISLLVEDLVQDYSETQQAAQPPAAGGPGPEGADPGLEGAAPRPDAGAGGNFQAVPGVPGAGGPGAGATAGPTHVDHLHENIFLPNEQSLGDIRVKVTIVDNESRFDLNRLFDYARAVLQGQGVLAADGSLLTADELAEGVLGAEDQESAEQSLRDRILSRTRAGSARTADSDLATGEAGAEGAEGGAGAASGMTGLEDEGELAEWTPPTPEVRTATVAILARAIEMVLSINEDNGYFYEEHYDSEMIAEEIVQYVVVRRESVTQNRMYHVSELLNLDRVTPELFYGPAVVIPEEGLLTDDGMFRLERDDFGDIVGAFLWDESFLADQDAQTEQLRALQEEFGAFMDFPGLGGLQASALTRGMTEPAQVLNDDGSEEVLEPPIPIGLEDLFTTFSTGKINLNTASAPVLYGLLPSLTEGPDGEANFVAVSIRDYRNRMQDYVDEAAGEIPDTEASGVKDLGQPRRMLPQEDEFTSEEFDPFYAAGGGSAYQDLETNYFTNLQQIELVDGTDGGADDQLRSDVGIDRVSAEDDTLLQRALNDFGKVMVFGSTYFTIELKAKAEGSPLVKSGLVIVKRDPTAKVLDVVLWKELQK